MNKLVTAVLGAGLSVVGIVADVQAMPLATAPAAQASQDITTVAMGCGTNMYRDQYGRCLPEPGRYAPRPRYYAPPPQPRYYAPPPVYRPRAPACPPGLRFYNDACRY